MKKQIIYSAVMLAALTSCNDDFLERTPLSEPTAETAFATYNNFKAYAWGLYETLAVPGYGETNSDNISYNSTRGSGESSWIRGTFVVPDSRSGAPWDYYSYIRRVNIMLDRIDGSGMTDAEKAHWRSVGYFFRSYRYYSLLSAYGDVPWIDHVLSDDEMDIIEGPRTPRDQVAANILADLKYAEENIKVGGDGNNTINKATVQALLSRFTLFEGTWRKYHGLQNAEQYLQECERVSKELVQSMPNVTPCYDDLFTSLSLSGVAGVILYREYSDAAGVTHAISIGGTTAQSFYNPTRDMVDSYLCYDGKPRWTSPVFISDHNMYDEFANRDHRLWLHVTPPYVVDRSGAPDAWSNKWKFTDDPADRAYIDSLAQRVGIGYGTSKERQKTLPFRQGFSGGVLGQVPHYDFFLNNQPWYKSAFGYNNWKFFATYLEQGAQRNEEVDMPIFRIEETMLNWAEAACELGHFDQAVADATINKLRPRANVAPMKVSEINSSFDPKRDLGDPAYPNDYEVSPLLWEIRRERRIELFSEGFRFDDLRRWKKCSYMMKQKLGQYVRKSDFPAGTKVTVYGDGAEGYLTFHPAPDHTWPEYYYLYPIPRNERVLNPQLTQNPGWDDGIGAE